MQWAMFSTRKLVGYRLWDEYGVEQEAVERQDQRNGNYGYNHRDPSIDETLHELLLRCVVDDRYHRQRNHETQNYLTINEQTERIEPKQYCERGWKHVDESRHYSSRPYIPVLPDQTLHYDLSCYCSKC